MKYFLKTHLLFLFVLVISCDSFDQGAFDQGLENEQNLDYKVPTTTPESSAQYDMLLHGEEQNIWVAREFSLEGLLGFQDCRLDDTFVLRSDGTYQFDGGDMLCGGEDVSYQSGSYSKDYENNQLIFDEGTDHETVMKINGIEEGVIAVSGKVDIFGVPMSIEGVYTIK